MKKSNIPNVYNLVFPKDFSFQNDGVTQGLLSKFLYCRYAFLITLNKLSKRGRLTNMLFGSVFHEILESYFKKGKLSEKEINYAIDNYICNNSDVSLEIEEDELEKTKIGCKVLFNFYQKKYYNIDKKLDIIKPELEFNIPFGSYNRRGKIDLAFKKNKKIWIMEHKVKSRIDGEGIEMKLSIDPQSLYYLTSLAKQLKLPAEGVIYDVIRNPSIRKSFEHNGKYEEYLTECIQKDPSHYFFRYRKIYLQNELDFFNKQIDNKIIEMMNLVNGKISLYRNENSCHNHAYACEHMQACCSNGDLINYKKNKVFYPELDIKK